MFGFLHQIGDRHIAAGAPRIVDRTVGALIVAAVLHFQERAGTVAARKGGEEIGQLLRVATGELCGPLARKSRYTPEKFALVVVAQHQIDPFDRGDLLRFELGIATGDDNNRRRVAPMDFTDQVTAFLVGMFGHRTTVDDRNIRRFRNPDPDEAARFEFTGEGRALRKVELAAQGVKIDSASLHISAVNLSESTKNYANPTILSAKITHTSG